jgi:serine/threonine protein phosphatase PrpC
MAMRSLEGLQRGLFDWLQGQPLGDHSELLPEIGVSLFTSQGRFRSNNEDRLAYVRVNRQTQHQSTLAVAVVADGIGGHVGGDRAASTAIAALSAYIAFGDAFGGLKSLLLKSVMYANDQVFLLLGGQGGTTLSAILYGKQGAIGINIGDSRIYAIRDGKVDRLTVDDTLEEQLRPIRGGGALNRPKDDRLVQFVGIGRDLEPHMIDLPSFSDTEDIRYLLTSDGAHFLGDSNLSTLFSSTTAPDDPTRAVVELSRLLGSQDNASAIACPKMVRLESDSAEPFISVSAPGRTFTALATPSFALHEPLLRPVEVVSQPPLFDDLAAVVPTAQQRSQSKKTSKGARVKATSVSKTKKGKRSSKGSDLQLVSAGPKGGDRKK